ncbi:ribosome recycling factor [Spiroplasma endosymbiont of Aspidapion aeneum]|uniref:ribosome recycling factor n=1 Tax=Spiroplasma endosymbiont of Aspidapion aeneum TaxID=3066276 RepID=UPI00313D2219
MEANFYEKIKLEMQKTIDNFEKDSHKYRLGKANARMVDSVLVDSYGTLTPLNQVAQISIPEPTQLLIKPYDRSQVQAISGAISKANINLTPLPEADVIRINVPKLTEEIRIKMVKELEKDLENFKVGIRNIRRDAINKLKREMDLSKDILKDNENQIQKITDEYISKLEKSFHDKQKDIMSI